jgi:prevent-host-death family protein
MKIAPVADVKARLSAYLKETENGPVVITRNGKPVAVLLAVQDEDELERLLLASSAQLREVLEAGRQQIQAGEGIAHEDFWAQVESRPKRRTKRPGGRAEAGHGPGPACESDPS